MVASGGQLTPLATSLVPGGLFSIQDASINSGRYFFVSSLLGSDTAGDGTVAAPYATVAAALLKCTAGEGDTIVGMPGHAENISAAGYLTMSITGVRILGMGKGDLRPVFTWTVAAGTILMTAVSCSIENCIFDLSTTSAIISAIVVSAASCTIKGNYFRQGAAGTGTAPLQAILTTAGADRLEIDGNQIIGPGATPTTVSAATTAIKLVGGTGIRITNNTILGWFTTSAGGIDNLTTACTMLVVEGNKIFNFTASSTIAATFQSGTNGEFVNNRLGVLSSTAPVVAAGMFMGGNAYVAAVGVTAGTAATF